MGYVYQVLCTTCDHKSSISTTPKKFVCKNEGLIDESLESAFGLNYCASCDMITSTFLGQPLTPWELDGLKDNYNKLTVQLNHTSWFRLNKKYSLKRKLFTLEYQIQSLSTKHQENMLFWNKTTSTPRCMDCGNKHIDLTKVELPESFPKERISNISHACGGKLIITRIMHISTSNVLYIYYDSEGNRLGEEHISK
ncbi:MAG: hypothetical protein EOO43_05570 [Flavobacterium sp.]|nr:MAG: hypothetical protein EOO43_05570 [Flavobacterium sp.]